MSANTAPVFVASPHVSGSQFTSTDTTTKKTLLTAGGNGTRIDGILCSTNDTTTVNLAFYINNGSIDFYIGNVNLPIGAGYTTIPRVDAMSTLEPTNLKALVIPAGYILKANCVATMTGAKTTDVLCVGGDF